MGTVTGIQGELDFDRLIPENASPVFKAIPRAIPQKAEPSAKTADRFIFEPLPDGNTADYSGFPANRMYIANEKTILTAERPQWVPPLDYRFVAQNSHIPPVRKIGENYVLQSGKDSPLYYKLSLDGFAATVDYYVKYGKALNRRKAEERNGQLLKEALENFNNRDTPLIPGSRDYPYYKSVIDGTFKIKPSPIRLLSVRIMTYKQRDFFKENKTGQREMWDEWRDIRTSLEQKMNDMSCQYDDLESSYAKGAETSYGDKNTSNALFEEFGILVKRQNGDAINRQEIGEIRHAFNRIKPVFGNLKTICAAYRLKVSHSGTKHMHARKYIGIFHEAYRAIGVKFGDTKNNHLVLAHELSHFLDSQAGKDAGHFFSSDKPGTIENRIAALFRKEMNQRSNATKNSKYLQRTCECFARAMEQFAAFAVSTEQYLYYCKSEAYAPDDSFREKLLPPIEYLIAERQDLWHKGETAMSNNPESFKSLEIQAVKETAEYRPSMNIGGMDDDFLEKMAVHASNRREWYLKTIERYKTMETLPQNTLETLKEARRVERLCSAFEKEYRKRLEKPDSPLFPIYPPDITADRFKEQFIALMKSPEYNKVPEHTAGILASKALPHNRDAVNEFLKSSGCAGEETTRKALQSWIENEHRQMPGKKHTKHRDTGISR
jgi:hypothetical protein